MGADNEQAEPVIFTAYPKSKEDTLPYIERQKWAKMARGGGRQRRHPSGGSEFHEGSPPAAAWGRHPRHLCRVVGKV